MNLDRIEKDIALGLKYKSVNRLKNLINENPDDLELRNRLAELYYEAGFYDAAGLFWILHQSNAPHVIKCVELYSASVNHSGSQILKELRFKGDRSKLSHYTNEIISALEEDSLRKTNHIPTFKQRFASNEKREHNNYNFGCFIGLTIVIILIIVFIVGVIQTLSWLFH